jgi:hypothetical protein
MNDALFRQWHHCHTCGAYVTPNSEHDEDACAVERQNEITHRGAAKARQALDAARAADQATARQTAFATKEE